jgi:hypothetical protein
LIGCSKNDFGLSDNADISHNQVNKYDDALYRVPWHFQAPILLGVNEVIASAVTCSADFYRRLEWEVYFGLTDASTSQLCPIHCRVIAISVRNLGVSVGIPSVGGVIHCTKFICVTLGTGLLKDPSVAFVGRTGIVILRHSDPNCLKFGTSFGGTTPRRKPTLYGKPAS